MRRSRPTPVANPGLKPITQLLYGYRCALGCDGGRRSSARCFQPYNGPSQNAASGGGGGVNWSRTLPESEKSRRVAEVLPSVTVVCLVATSTRTLSPVP